VVLTGAVSAVTPLRPQPRPYDAPVLEILRPGSRRLLAGPLRAITGLREQLRP